MDRRIIHAFLINDNGTIEHTRGDTAQFSLSLEWYGKEIDSFDAVFSVKHYPDDDVYLYQEIFNHNTPCTITHLDTVGIPYGTYWWDIQTTFMINELINLIIQHIMKYYTI